MTARLPQLIWLTAVWVLLWGTVDAKTLLGGVLVAALVTVAFPLPVIGERLRVRPVQLLWLTGYLAADLVVSGVKISWQTVRYGPRATAGIVTVPLLTDSDRVATAVSNAVSLAPGTFVLHLDHQREVCYVYNLGMRGPADAQRVRSQEAKSCRPSIQGWCPTLPRHCCHGGCSASEVAQIAGYTGEAHSHPVPTRRPSLQIV